MSGQPWTMEECRTAAKLWREAAGAPEDRYTAIGKALDRTYYSVRARYNAFGSNFAGENKRPYHGHPSGHFVEHRRRVIVDGEAVTVERRVPDEVLAERDRRQALEPINLTAAFCGDPLPGYSALDRRQSR